MKQTLIPLISADKIGARVKELAATISAHYRGKETILLCILKGASVFMADLMRLLEIDYECEFVRLSSYGDGTKSSGSVRVVSELSGSMRDKHVLIIDCVVDTGLTLMFLTEHLRKKGPSTVSTCVLLNKSHPGRDSSFVQLDYVGFSIPDLFVVGYGLDWAERHRGLPYIAYLRSRGN